LPVIIIKYNGEQNSKNENSTKKTLQCNNGTRTTSKRIILITGSKLIIVHDNQDSLQRILDLFDMLQYD
jgi:hypothetical protein